MEDLTCGDITDILDEYDIRYSYMKAMGDVDIGSQEIRLNPMYNHQDVPTLIHEFAHIWYEEYLELKDVPEHIIEFESQNKLKEKGIYQCLEGYLKGRTQDQRLDYEL